MYEGFQMQGIAGSTNEHVYLLVSTLSLCNLKCTLQKMERSSVSLRTSTIYQKSSDRAIVYCAMYVCMKTCAGTVL